MTIDALRPLMRLVSPSEVHKERALIENHAWTVAQPRHGSNMVWLSILRVSSPMVVVSAIAWLFLVVISSSR